MDSHSLVVVAYDRDNVVYTLREACDMSSTASASSKDNELHSCQKCTVWMRRVWSMGVWTSMDTTTSFVYRGGGAMWGWRLGDDSSTHDERPRQCRGKSRHSTEMPTSAGVRAPSALHLSLGVLGVLGVLPPCVTKILPYIPLKSPERSGISQE